MRYLEQCQIQSVRVTYQRPVEIGLPSHFVGTPDRDRGGASHHVCGGEYLVVANEEARVVSYPNAAIVIGTYHTKGTYKRQPFEHYGRFTDTWLYQNNKWQCVASHTTLINKK